MPGKCRRYHAQLSLLAAGSLRSEERPPVEAHVEVCPSCRARFVEFQRLVTQLDSMAAGLAPERPSLSLRRRWQSAVAAASAETRPRPWMAVSVWLTGRRAAWGALTVIWGLIALLNFTAHDRSRTRFAVVPPPLDDVLLVLETGPAPDAFPRPRHRGPGSASPSNSEPTLPRSDRREEQMTNGWRAA